MYGSAVFIGGPPVCTQILPGQGRPHQHSWHQKTRDTGLPDDEDHILLCSLVLTQYWSVMGRRTDRWTCGGIYSARKANAKRCKKTKNVKTVAYVCV